MKHRIAALGFLAFALEGVAQAAPAHDPVRIAGVVDGLVVQAMETHQAPGAVVAVVGPEGLIHAASHGIARLAPEETPVTADTLFRLASISKTFVYIAVMQLVEQGTLDLDDPVNRHLPEALQVPDQGFEGTPILVRHLMTHTAGFEDSSLGHLFVDEHDELLATADYLVRYRPLRVRPPGVLPAYSNYGIALLGEAVAHVSGEPFVDYAERRIFQPLGMASTSFREPYPVDIATTRGLPAPLDASLADRSAQVIAGRRGEWRTMHEEFALGVAPAGSARSSAADMARFAHALLDPARLEAAGVLLEQTFRAMMRPLHPIPGEPSFAGRHGFATRWFPGGPRGFGHAGGMARSAADLIVLPDQGLAIFVASPGPSGFAFVHATGERVMRALAPWSDPTPVRDSETIALAKSIEGAWLATRRAYGRTEGALQVIQTEFASVDEEGNVSFGSPLGPSRRFMPIGGGHWYSPDARRTLTIGAGRDGLPRLWLGGTIAYERVAPWRSIAWIGPAFLGAAFIGVLALSRLGRRLFAKPVASRSERIAGALTDAAAMAWLFGVAGVLATLVQGLRDNYASVLFAYPGAIPVYLWLVTAGTVLSVAALVAFVVAIRRADGQWSRWRWFTRGLAVLVLVAAGTLAVVNGWIGFSDFPA